MKSNYKNHKKKCKIIFLSFVGYRRPMEGDVELGEAAVLRRTIAAVEATHGEAPRL